MKKWGTRIAKGLGVIATVLVLVVAGAYTVSASKEATSYEVSGASFDIPSDPSALPEGERLFVSRGCASPDCHTEDGGGSVMMQDGPFGTIAAPNLTRIARDLAPADWDRAVRHGLRRDGTSLMFMPSGDFSSMGDRELGLIAAYARSLPSVDRDLPPSVPGMLARVIDLADGFELFPASAIDHDAVAQPDPEPGRTVEFGAYLATLCKGCHGAQLSGGPIPGAPPEMGFPLNLTPHETGLAGWTEEQFRTVLRAGVTPSGRAIPPNLMPWPTFARMTDDEIGAIFLYLQTIPPVPEGSR